MQVQVKNLEPNPFRNIEKYEIEKERVEALKNSIEETSFWDNILGRPSGNKKIQIAYGHHRLIALRELNIKQVDMPIRNLDDATMIKIMANENMDSWGTRPAVVNETVQVAKEFLDEQLAEYDSFEKLPITLSVIFEGHTRTDGTPLNPKAMFAAAKRPDRGGAGRETIVKFLGDNWKEWMVQEALQTMKDHEEGKVDRKAVEEFPSLQPARAFRSAVKEHKVPKKKQQAMARSIVKEGIGKRGIKKEVRDRVIQQSLPPKKPKKADPPWVGEFAMKLETKVDALAEELQALAKVRQQVKPRTIAPLAAALEEFCKTAVKIINRSLD